MLPFLSRALALAAPIVLLESVMAAAWMVDSEAACARAAAEHKMVLVDFTGSDWCHFCMLLRQQVFDTPAFDAYARDRFVLLEIDLPNSSRFDPQLRARNEAICHAYGIRCFPTVLVLTPSGDVAGGFVGLRDSLAAARDELEAALANGRALQRARELAGTARRDALMACYLSLPEPVRPAAKSLRAEVVRLDPDDTCGLRDEVLAEQQRDSLRRQLDALKHQPGAARDLLVAALPTALPANRLELLNALYPLQIKAADSLDDLEQARQTMLEILRYDPPYAASIRRLLERRFADPAALLRQVREQRRQRALHDRPQAIPGTDPQAIPGTASPAQGSRCP